MTMIHDCLLPVIAAGVDRDDAIALRRAAMTLRRWFELECGTEDGAIERDEITGKPYWRNAMTDRGDPRYHYPVADREAGAMRRIKAIMARYPELGYYVQGDCRGASLYVLRPGDIPASESADSYYDRGMAIYK